MKINDIKINKVITKYNQLKKIDVYFDNRESQSLRDEKIILLGKLCGYEEVLKQLGILD